MMSNWITPVTGKRSLVQMVKTFESERLDDIGSLCAAQVIYRGWLKMARHRLAPIVGFFALMCVIGGAARAQIVVPAKDYINTVVGNGILGYSGDGGLAANAEISSPMQVAFDSSGNLYFADMGNNRIRKVTASSGIITTVAGNGTEGYSGDGGLAVNAELYMPEGVAVDSSGNIYIADTYNDVVREVNASTGVISTIAGGGPYSLTDGNGNGMPATYVQLVLPERLAVDSSKNVYITSGDIPSVRLVTASTGIISTIVGITAYPFGGGYTCSGGNASTSYEISASAIALDSSDDIYIAQSYPSCVLLAISSTGELSLVAGDGTTGYTGDGGAATSAEVVPSSGIAVNSLGTVYFSNSNYNVPYVGYGGIRMVKSGTITTIAGNDTAGYSGDGGLAINAVTNSPTGVALDSAGNVYFADSGNSRIRVIGEN